MDFAFHTIFSVSLPRQKSISYLDLQIHLCTQQKLFINQTFDFLVALESHRQKSIYFQHSRIEEVPL